MTLNFLEPDEEEIEVGTSDAIEKIETHCRNLHRISVYDMELMNEKLANLLASYGDKVE